MKAVSLQCRGRIPLCLTAGKPKNLKQVCLTIFSKAITDAISICGYATTKS
jgi:hypothetical protein